MRLARILHRRSVLPRLALERDGFLYDVEALEEALGAAIPVPGSASSFRARVVALGLAGLRELDQRVLRGERPRAAAIDAREAVLLAPFDAETGAHVHSRDATSLAIVGLSRAVLGHAAFVGATSSEGVVRAGVAFVLGEDLHRATTKEVRAALSGTTLTLRWEGFAEHATAQAGPVLVTTEEFKLPGAAMMLRSPRGEERFAFTREVQDALEARVVRLSEEFELRGGDLLSFDTPLAHQVRVHEAVTLELASLALSGTAVPRRPRDAS